MRKMKRVVGCAVLALMVSGLAGAIEPAYRDQFGNPEEPALRPYKWFWRGLKALVYQTGKGFVDGNQDYPIIGTVYTFRGFRRGVVELERSMWLGMQGSNNRTWPQSNYKETGPQNAFIESDPVVCFVADGAAAMYGAGLLSGSADPRPFAAWMGYETAGINAAASQAGLVIIAGEYVLDPLPTVPELEKKLKAKKAQKKHDMELMEARKEFLEKQEAEAEEGEAFSSKELMKAARERMSRREARMREARRR